MSHIVLDVNIVVDLCVTRAGSPNSLAAVALAKEQGFQLWVYTGSVQTLEYVVASELCYARQKVGETLSRNTARQLARQVLEAITANYQWLAALAAEGAVFADADPEDTQLIRSLARFAAGTAKLLTRDSRMLERCGDATITPETFIKQNLQHHRLAKLEFIDLKTQQNAIRPQLEQSIHRVLHHGMYIMGKEISELEEDLAQYVGVKHCISVSDGTTALLIAMMALGIGPSDEIITTPFTFIATGEMIALLGAKPIFVDIDPKTYNIDPLKIEAAITNKTKAIMPVSLYGQCADFDVINSIAKKHSLPVIEDAAQSFGATYKGLKSCSLSTIACTSFFPSKPLGCYGDGGAIFTDDDSLATLIKQIRLHGQDRHYHHPIIGLNGRMDTLQAAVLQTKLKIFPKEIENRQRIAAKYDEHLRNFTTIPHIEPWNTSVYAQYTILVDNREHIQATLKESEIPTAIHYPIPLNLQPAFAGLGQLTGSFPIAEAIAQRVISLPMSPYLDQQSLEKITSAIVKLL